MVNFPADLTFLLRRIVSELPESIPVYLVGGAVRDLLLNHTVHDLDFVLPGNALETARRLADKLHVAYYPLDAERDTARLIWTQEDGTRMVLDFSAPRGVDLEEDLRNRDFTINAMALDLRHPDKVIDPLGGAADLQAKRLRSCTSIAFSNDPVRILRALRVASAFRLHILPETRQEMRKAVPLLVRVSAERIRDELFRILEGHQPATVLRGLDLFGVLDYVLPELVELKGVEQSMPHTRDVWEHTLDVLIRLEILLALFDRVYDEDKSSSLNLGLATLRLGRYREKIAAHLSVSLNPNRSLRGLLFLSCLYHDIAKPQTRRVDPKGKVRFFDHDRLGAEIGATRARALRLSNLEANRIETIIRHHLRPILLAGLNKQPTRRAIYRFFRDTGPAGVDICLLSLADVLGTYGTILPQDVWDRQLEVVRILLDAWWEKPRESVSPPRLLDGKDLMERFHLTPGPKVGYLLEAIREAQAEGKVGTMEEALALAKDLLSTE